MNISIFGTGYVGLTTGVCLANLGHNILCVDINQNKINQIQGGNIPFFEPDLKELVLKNQQKNNLNFTTNSQKAINFAEAIFNCVGTPSQEDGSANLTYIFQVAETIAQHAQNYKLLINKSTVPPGTAKKCAELIKSINPQSQVEVASNPEFLKEGNAIYDFTHPDKIVVGAKSDQAFNIIKKIYTGRVRTYIPILETNWETAETIKYANNSFLATKISFINEIANICDKVGADIRLISQALGLDYRISPKFLNPGIGYGGSCFPKDVRALIARAKEENYHPKLLQEVDQLNQRQKLILLEKIKQKFNNLQNKTFTILGLSFKPKTSDMREAPSITLITNLLQLGAQIKAYDPIATEESKMIFKDQIIHCSSIQEATQNSNAIILTTEWDEFRNINFTEVGKNMQQKIIFDGRNIYEPEIVQEEGFEYFGIGRK